ncbi:BZ3500_MvSof-1268-A1-R1_Chr7-3g09699 [Microbotryum saponariae]|uniref:BZ3500_MvSof-1268-A1-R1_Chr7-3g09699 protein n=1 Tax=Microbotryum saponariae TaxID=289078 RepID=A0A2X0KY91_9BASI|nr:BZ3501_MvSof-1269-A2-R1_Chr7-2g09422 [Microbotryum saponariae]SDA02437.1 BZ3500_MvSof-1268-A1-R1_Chr7-3g09699 [Microbotryum saponariae]
MKHSLFIIAFVVMAAVNVSALPADAIEPTSEIMPYALRPPSEG